MAAQIQTNKLITASPIIIGLRLGNAYSRFMNAEGSRERRGIEKDSNELSAFDTTNTLKKKKHQKKKKNLVVVFLGGFRLRRNSTFTLPGSVTRFFFFSLCGSLRLLSIFIM